MAFSDDHLKELFPSTGGESQYSGEIYLKMLVKAWHSQNRSEKLEDTLRVIIDNELEDVIEDVFSWSIGEPEQKTLELAEKTLAVFKRRTVKRLMKNLTRRVRSPSSRSWYQSVQLEDLKLAGTMAYLFDLKDRAFEVVDEALVISGLPPKLPPPK